MYTIIGKQNLTDTVRRLDIKAEALVARLKPGHFITLTLDPATRPIPYNIFEIDWRRKCLSIIFEETDGVPDRLGELRINDPVYAVGGPFGVPVPMENKGIIVCVGEGLRIASLLGLARSLKNVGNKVIGVAGFEMRKTSLFESQLRLNCNKFYVMYKDGMHDRKGDVIAPLRKVLAEERVTRVYADTTPETLSALRVLAAEKGVPVAVNMMDVVKGNGAFDENSPIVIGGCRYFPAVEGIIIDAQHVDLREAGRVIAARGDYFACRKKERGSARRHGVFTRLKKLFWA